MTGEPWSVLGYGLVLDAGYHQLHEGSYRDFRGLPSADRPAGRSAGNVRISLCLDSKGATDAHETGRFGQQNRHHPNNEAA